MTTPEPRFSMPRSSFAIAMKDYTFIRPGIAVIISAATLVVALIFGLDLIASLRHAAATVRHGARATQTLHRYNAGLEVWRRMATSTAPAYQRPERVAHRDSIRQASGPRSAPSPARSTTPSITTPPRRGLEGLPAPTRPPAARGAGRWTGCPGIRAPPRST